MLSKVVENACKLLGADDGSVGLVENDPRRMIVTAAHNLPEDEVGSEWAPGSGLAGLILTTSRPLIINRYGDIDPQNRPELAENAVVGVPIIRRKRLIGFFGIGARPPRQFTQADIRILSQFAKASAVAIENARLFESTQDSLRQTQLLYSTATTLSHATKLDDVVRLYLGLIATSLKVNSMVVLYERGGHGEIAWNVVRGRCTPEGKITTMESRTPHVRDNLDDLLEDGEMVIFSNIRTDPRAPKALKQMQKEDGNPALALIPLVSRGKRVGLVTLSRSSTHEWKDSEIQPFAVTAAHLAAAIDIRREQEQLAEERANLALTEERRRLARDLHDSVTQSLFAMQLLSQAIIGETTESGAATAAQLADLCRSSLKEMRALLSELRPLDTTTPHAQDVREPLRKRLTDHAKALGMTAELSIDDKSFAECSREVDHALFRIAQEALTNAHKHSEATWVVVELKSTGKVHRLSFTDNGKGFAMQPIHGERYGLVGMRERATAASGEIDISSSPGNGVKIRVEFPR